MIALITILAIAALGAIAGTVSLVARDGYRRQPERKLVRIY
jgi:hypothetical protein